MLTIPTTAVVTEKDKTFCVVVAGGKAVHRPIELGLNDGTRIEVVSGLDGSEAVVKANAASLVHGQPVEVVEPENPLTSKRKYKRKKKRNASQKE